MIYPFSTPWFVKIWILIFGFNEFYNYFKDLNCLKLGAVETASSEQLQATLWDQMVSMICRLMWYWWFPSRLESL
jgi:hypothetical protein